MTDSNEEEGRLRKFLLGELAEEERERVEERFLTDPDFKDRVLAAQDELVEEYAEGSLSDAERRRVAATILSSLEGRRRLRTATLIKKYVDVEKAAHSPPPGEKIKQNGSQRFAAFGLRRPYVSVALAAVVLLAIGFGAVKLLDVRRLNEQRAREHSQREAVERELAQLNDASLDGAGAPPAYSVPLTPVFVRSVSTARVVSPPASAAVVELRLALAGGGYETYRAVIQKLDDPARFAVPNLRASVAEGRMAIHLKVPARLLTRGDYQLSLSGVSADGKAEEVGEYNFQVPE